MKTAAAARGAGASQATTARQAVLEARGLAVGHGSRVVASDLSFALEPGRVLCLLGPNGGGKTTLLRTLLGLLPPLGGSVLLDGRRIDALARRHVARRIAYVPQAGQGGFAFTALDAVTMGRAARLPFLAVPGRVDRAVALAALERLGIGALAPRPVDELSGGERQLVLLARALAQEAACLVLDEPTASLDFGNQVRVLKQLRALARRDGFAVLMTTHHPDQAFLIADHVAILDAGGLRGPAPPAELLTSATLGGVYGVPIAVAEIATQAGPRGVCVPLLG